MPIYLNAIAARFYRGIGPETQYISGFSEMNFFIGPNNAGKSVILNLIHDQLPFGTRQNLTNVDQSSTAGYRGAETGQFSCAVGVFPTELIQNLQQRAPSDHRASTNVYESIRIIIKHLIVEGSIWLVDEGHANVMLSQVPDAKSAQHWLSRQQAWHDVWSPLTNRQGGGIESWVSQTFSVIAQIARPSFPECLLIPAKRKLGPKDETFEDQSGKGLIDHLAKMQNPDWNERSRLEDFHKINEFVRVVTGKPDAQLIVPENKQHLLIEMDNKVLPLDSLGTGIPEIILIAAFCTIHQEKIMCIEEPEIHLHPILQRKLIRYLTEKTQNQYFIATHSAAFIDTPDASVFRVHNDGVQTYVSAATQRGEKRRICDDLGYKASDVMQANAVIWVEGPSDRLYIKHWLHAVDDGLIEGIHYSIMFYGGALIKHLSADDEALEDFIKLRELNRNFAVILDSDRQSPQSKLKPAAQRISDEISSDGGIAWITKGREIENYVAGEQLQTALRELHTTLYASPCPVGPYDHAFYFTRNKPTKTGETVHKEGDKVGAARKICEQTADLSILDLKARITELAAMIVRANELD